MTAYRQSVDVPLEMSQRLGRRRRAVERHQLTGSVAALYVDDDGALKRQICRPADKKPEKKEKQPINTNHTANYSRNNIQGLACTK